MTGTGLKKCSPPKLALFFRLIPMSLRRREDVLVVKIASLQKYNSDDDKQYQKKEFPLAVIRDRKLFPPFIFRVVSKNGHLKPQE